MDMLLDEERVVLDMPVDAHVCDVDGCAREGAWWYEHSCGSFAVICADHRPIWDMEKHTKVLFCTQCGGDVPNPIPWVSL